MNEDHVLETLKSINMKLNIIVAEMICNNNKDATTRDLVSKLYSMGMDSAGIAEILSISVGYASKEISILKKSQGAKDGKQKN